MADDVPFETLPWDTAWFGFPVARIKPASLELPGLEAVLRDLKSRGTVLACWFADPLHAESAHAAAASGGFLADRKLTYRAERPAFLPPDPAWPVAPAHPETSREALLDLAVRAGRHSRFRVDPRFPQDRFKALYEEWMRKSLAGELAEAVLVAEDREGPAGMITVDSGAAGRGEGPEPGSAAGTIGLLAVAERAEGRGLGSALVRAAGNWFAERGCASARVVTQEANQAACRLYGKHGYRVEKREDVWHFWLDGR